MISAIIPTKDRHKMLREAVNSLLDQTTPVSQIIVVNDAGARVNLESLFPGRDLSCIELIDLPENKGGVHARNEALKTATGQWVMFLDDDDMLAPEHCAVMLEHAHKNNSQFVHSDAVIFGYEYNHESENRDVVWERVFAYSSSPEQMKTFSTYVPSGSMIQRQYLNELGGLDTNIPHHWDWDLYLRAMRQEAPCRVPYAGVRYAIHSPKSDTQNRSANMTSMRKSLDNLQEKHKLPELPTANFLTLLDMDFMMGRVADTNNPWVDIDS